MSTSLSETKSNHSVVFIDEKWSWNVPLTDFLTEGNTPSEWLPFFQRDDIKEILTEISDRLTQDNERFTIYPEINRVFRAFSVALEDISVVVLGQDPYHNGNAVGICFSVPPNEKINPSLRNIYTELEREDFKVEKNGDLSPWAKQGCFMINTALTVRKGIPDSHTHFWRKFTQELVKFVVKNSKNVAWLLMGSKALYFEKFIKGNGHEPFITSHPSPFSAHKNFRSYPAFLGSGVFREINDFLKENEKKCVRW